MKEDYSAFLAPIGRLSDQSQNLIRNGQEEEGLRIAQDIVRRLQQTIAWVQSARQEVKEP